MRISELSRRTLVPVGTVKFYLREGLLPAGTRTSATQAEYDEAHVDRLRLVRVLLGTAGLSVAAALEVVAALDSPPGPIHDLLGVAHRASGSRAGTAANEADRHRAVALVRGRGWQVHDQTPALDQLAEALAAMAEIGLVDPEAVLDSYARAAEQLAEVDVAGVPTGDPVAAVRHVITGTILLEPVLLALRRLAQEDVSARRFGSS